ncbi:MAG: hypothetical protein C4539_04900 [Ignavibacteriales bacterium]|nr:MAG: hypothetical protein C4539_04900 [Ignavibacteriales bacterium]
MYKMILFLVFLFLVVVKAQDITVEQNFEGIQSNGKKPPDPEIAVGPNHVVLTVNNRVEIYSKTGTLISGSTLSDWFSPLNQGEDPFDPKIVYDHFSGRWIIYALTKYSALYLLSVSQSSDPTAGWYNFTFDAYKDNGTSTLNHPDYTGLGFNEEAIFLCAVRSSLLTAKNKLIRFKIRGFGLLLRLTTNKVIIYNRV